MKKTTSHSAACIAAPTEAEIRERAYYLWLDQGCPSGRDQEIWFAARVLLHDRIRRLPGSASAKQAAHSRDPQHRYHNPAIRRDARPAVARTGAPQRIRAHSPKQKETSR